MAGHKLSDMCSLKPCTPPEFLLLFVIHFVEAHAQLTHRHEIPNPAEGSNTLTGTLPCRGRSVTIPTSQMRNLRGSVHLRSQQGLVRENEVGRLVASLCPHYHHY